MLKIQLDFGKLKTAVGKNLVMETVDFRGVQVVCLRTHCYVECEDINTTVPDAVKEMVLFFTIEETIAGPGHQWRRGEYTHCDTGDATAYFDGSIRSSEERILKMRATKQSDIVALRNAVLQIKPGICNRIKGLNEPPVDAWNAGYDAGMRANEASKPTYNERLDIALMLLRAGALNSPAIQRQFQNWLKTQPEPTNENQFITWAANVLLA